MEAVHFGMSSYHLILRLTGLAALLLSWGTSSAQPIIGTGDLPQGGETYIRANAVPAVFSDIVEDGGVDLTWDFSDLIATGDLENEYFPMSAANITTQFVFSSADHFTAFELPEIGLDNPLPISGATTYLQFGSSAYKVIGLGITTDIFDLPVRSNGETVVTLSDVATIRRTFKDRTNYARVNGRDTISLNVIKRANATTFGLGSGVWTTNVSKAHQVAKALRAGSVWVNCYQAMDPAVPFGGYKMSGYGRESGKQHVEEYLNVKAVWIKTG